MAEAKLGRLHSFRPASLHFGRAKHDGINTEGAKRLQELEQEISRLVRLLAEAHLDIEALRLGFGAKRLLRKANSR